jgi:hypothetical protein
MFLKNKQKLQLIWTYENMVKFNHYKVPNYQMVKILKQIILHMNLSSSITSYIDS